MKISTCSDTVLNINMYSTISVFRKDSCLISKKNHPLIGGS